MLIDTLNKKRFWVLGVFAFLVFATGGHEARAHGHHGDSLDADESAQLYASMMKALDEASYETQHILNDLELRYGGKPISDVVYVQFMEQRIQLSAPAFSKLVDRGLDLFKAQVHNECQHCHHHHEVLKDPLLRSKVFSFFKEWLIHYAKLLQTPFQNPRVLATGAIRLSGQGLRLAVIHGPLYLVYTAITEAIESTVMGPAHWACTFFQALYFPAAFVAHQIWDPIRNTGHAVSLLSRLGISMKSVYLQAKFRRQMQTAFVETSLLQKKGTPLSVELTSKSYKKYLAGLHHDIEKELNEKNFWAEIYRNFHLPQTRPQTKHSHESNPYEDLKVIFEMNPHHSTMRTTEAERFYFALKHIDGLRMMLSLNEQLYDHLFESKQLSAGNYIKASHLIGLAGSHFERYKTLLLAGALSPRDNIAVQFYQETQAERALGTLLDHLKNSHAILEFSKSDNVSDERLKSRITEAKTTLQQEATGFRQAMHKRIRMTEADADRCASLMSLVR